MPTALAIAFAYPIEFGFGGSGQTIAIVAPALAAQSDLNSYASTAALPVTPTLNGYTYQGGNSSPNTDEILEATLDAETIAGLAPYATIDEIEIPSLSNQYALGATTDAVEQLHANVVSLSFAGCESDDSAYDQAFDQISEEAAATGTTIVAAAGDQGPTCPSSGTQINGVSEPASDPFVVAAGGNQDLIQPPYQNYSQVEQSLRNPMPWNDTTLSGGGSGGGGVSAVWSIPSYQNAPGIVSTAESRTFRNLPDIALPASNDSGPNAIYVQGAWMDVGGTSWSAPEFAAMQAEINQQCGASRWGLPDLYRVYYQAPSSFVDVVSGDISWTTTSLTYPAGAGYDNASGLGLPLGEAIAVEDGC